VLTRQASFQSTYSGIGGLLKAYSPAQLASTKGVGRHLNRLAAQLRYHDTKVIPEQSHGEYDLTLRPADERLDSEVFSISELRNGPADLIEVRIA
jgi:hypothetical protein